ncbi:MAG TPA: thermonuclease family protein [Caulobacterales bacterium]|nr:thermonuclease family protein [Caulobacterales bacterium]
MRWGFALACLLLLAGCGPDIGNLQKGEEGRVARVLSGDALELDGGLRVFLAEVQAPQGEQPYADAARAELESLALHRKVRLAYGGTRRWRPRPREGQPATAMEAAIAHVYVESEGGRWFWLQRELIARGAVMIRPRHDNHVRASELASAEADARAARKGLWTLRDYRVLDPADASAIALAANQNCLRREAPYRVVEARVEDVHLFDRRAALDLDAGEHPFQMVVFGESFTNWDGAPLASLKGKRIRVHGGLGVYHDQPQLCIDEGAQIELLR